MPKCPEYIKSIYNLFDKNTYLIQAHSKVPDIGSEPIRLDKMPTTKIKGINDVFLKVPDNVYIVYGTPSRCALFDVESVDTNLKTQLKNNDNKLVLSQNPYNYHETETYSEFLDNMGIYCPGDTFFDFGITFDDNPNMFNISKIEKRKIISAYNRDHSVRLGRNLRNLITVSIQNHIYFKLSYIIEILQELSRGEVIIIYLLSCNLGPSQTDYKAAYMNRGAYVREYDAISDQIIEKGLSNIEYLRIHSDFVSTRGRRRPVISDRDSAFEDSETLSCHDVAEIEGKYIRKGFQRAVDKVISDYPYGWSDNGCVCVDKCKPKKEYGVLGSMCDDCDKYYCEVDGECKDEIIKNDGGKRYHKSVKKWLAKCPEKV
tara:strand:+ start:2592 stop:3710 length:1119 start_codon:yes stop_codon:yes gene_type:complete